MILSDTTEEPQWWTTVVTIGLQVIVPAVVALFISWVANRHQEKRLRREFKLQESAEKAVSSLLSHEKWTMRSFKEIEGKLSGAFSEKQLRQILVRAGAISFKGTDGEELWGLLDKNKRQLQSLLSGLRRRHRVQVI